jgi:hypothetical protein
LRLFVIHSDSSAVFYLAAALIAAVELLLVLLLFSVSFCDAVVQIPANAVLVVLAFDLQLTAI